MNNYKLQSSVQRGPLTQESVLFPLLFTINSLLDKFDDPTLIITDADSHAVAKNDRNKDHVSQELQK